MLPHPLTPNWNTLWSIPYQWDIVFIIYFAIALNANETRINSNGVKKFNTHWQTIPHTFIFFNIRCVIPFHFGNYRIKFGPIRRKKVNQSMWIKIFVNYKSCCHSSIKELPSGRSSVAKELCAIICRNTCIKTQSTCWFHFNIFITYKCIYICIYHYKI